MADTSLRLPGRTIAAPRRFGVDRARIADAWRLRQRITPRRVARWVWGAFWLPYWIGGDVPAPELPHREPHPPAQLGLAGDQVLLTLDRLTRRIWLHWALNVIIRGAWIGGVVGIGWLIIEQFGGPDFEPRVLAAIGIALFANGFVLAALLRPSRTRTARMLDRSFQLHERMSTALENLGRAVPPPGVRAQIVYLQMADAANVIADLRRHQAFRLRAPLRELVLALACALLLAALFFLRGVGGGIPEIVPAAVPQFTSAAERPQEQQPLPNQAAAPPGADQAPSSAEVQERAARSNEAQRDLATLGRALDDHAVTHQVAEAIARGDYDEAAEELRDLAQHADELQPEAREALADDLDAAAAQMSQDGNSELAQATRAAADGLRQGGEPAQEGLEQLGDAVQSTGEDVLSQQELSDQMAAAQAAESSGTQSEPGEGGEGASEQDGEPGDVSERRAPGGEGQSGEGQPGETGSQSDGGQSGTQSQEPVDRGNNPAGPQNQGQGEQRGRSSRSASQPGQPGMPQAGEPSSGDPGSPADMAGNPGESGVQDGTQAQSGAGAGTGDAEQPGGEQPEGMPSETGAPGEGLPAEARVTTAEVPPGEEGSEAQAADDAIQLDRTAGQGIQTGNDPSSASPGSGTGVTTASGDATQQEVGAAGPDSNRVPPEDRDIVEDYFSDPEGDE